MAADAGLAARLRPVMPDGLYLRPRFLPAGDAALTIELGDAIGAELNERVLAFDAAVRAAAIPGIVETVPTYHSLVVHYDPTALGAAEQVGRASCRDTECPYV